MMQNWRISWRRKKRKNTGITLIGAGTIGLSFAALHLKHLNDPSQLVIYDTRPDLREYISSTLPKYLSSNLHDAIQHIKLFNTPSTLPAAVQNATIIQEQGPENLPFKQQIWASLEAHAPSSALLRSSTSGIPASAQARFLHPSTRKRLLVVHPYNPPHIMPLLEVVPSPETASSIILRTEAFWKARGREPVVVHKEMTGFVANRLAFALLREAIHLVKEGVVSVEDVDRIVTSSMGPRWAVWGPFKSYRAGGGSGGLEAFFKNIGGTAQECWNDAGRENVGEGWEREVFRQCENRFGMVDTVVRDMTTEGVLKAAKRPDR